MRTEKEDIAVLKSKMDDVEDDIRIMRDDIAEIKETITGAKGSWKTFIAVLGILTTGFFLLFDKILGTIFK
jgi:hypothetical protein